MAGMGQVELPPDEELGRLALLLARRFINRWDMYPQQIPDGRYVTIHEPLTSSHLLVHLRGETTLGAYILDRQSQARFVVLDADDGKTWKRLGDAARSLEGVDVPSYLEQSRRGGHLWIFLSQKVPGNLARDFGRGIVAAFGLDGVELYPKQSELVSGPGSLIRLPFGVHRKTGQRYGFFTPTGEMLAPTIGEQIRRLAHPLAASEAGFEAYRSYAVPPEAKALARPPRETEQMAGEWVSEKIKGAVTVEEFVGRFVNLDDRGWGFCPFHDDQHKSFSVNREGGYWNCFAGCGGGSIIDFWMKYRDVDFTTAVKELAEMLL
jgi:hypothetical protein